ncbi:hypothetical protein DPMN_097200 [Dreissena polymorpha]|uniref:Uncharacterized protein n=1 Tax=Dreissena polymorpha TaxID=45954 RepID=A0A9D4R4I5_DREPO|nr:hypothetical protein DPMN_097200 [Dreissena polymorpha]
MLPYGSVLKCKQQWVHTAQTWTTTPMSVVIAEDVSAVYYTVGTNIESTKFDNTIALNQTASDEKDIALSFHQGVLTGKLGNVETVLRNIPGNLCSVLCALHIGDSDRVIGDRFKGELDELSIYLCA